MDFLLLNFILPDGFVGSAQVGDGKPPENGSTTGPNLSGESWMLRKGSVQRVAQNS
jgi:hypothetical protein